MNVVSPSKRPPPLQRSPFHGKEVVAQPAMGITGIQPIGQLTIAPTVEAYAALFNENQQLHQQIADLSAENLEMQRSLLEFNSHALSIREELGEKDGIAQRLKIQRINIESEFKIIFSKYYTIFQVINQLNCTFYLQRAMGTFWTLPRLYVKASQTSVFIWKL